jgi:hypothetical protein
VRIVGANAGTGRVGISRLVGLPALGRRGCSLGDDPKDAARAARRRLDLYSMLVKSRPFCVADKGQYG